MHPVNGETCLSADNPSQPAAPRLDAAWQAESSTRRSSLASVRIPGQGALAGQWPRSAVSYQAASSPTPRALRPYRGHSTPVFYLAYGEKKWLPLALYSGRGGWGVRGKIGRKAVELEHFDETGLDAADSLSPLIPNPSPPEYRVEKGARIDKGERLWGQCTGRPSGSDEGFAALAGPPLRPNDGRFSPRESATRVGRATEISAQQQPSRRTTSTCATLCPTVFH